MSDFTVEIYDSVNILEIETTTEDNTDTLEINTSTIETIDVSTGFVGSVIYASDIIGLDNYLSNFIDNYDIDCGTP